MNYNKSIRRSMKEKMMNMKKEEEVAGIQYDDSQNDFGAQSDDD